MMSDRLTAWDIDLLLDRVIGSTTAIGDSAADHRIEENLDVLIDVTNRLMDKIYESSRTSDSPYGSMAFIGAKARKALQEICETYIERSE